MSVTVMGHPEPYLESKRGFYNLKEMVIERSLSETGHMISDFQVRLESINSYPGHYTTSMKCVFLLRFVDRALNLAEF